jgi:hypothetical protein
MGVLGHVGLLFVTNSASFGTANPVHETTTSQGNRQQLGTGALAPPPRMGPSDIRGGWGQRPPSASAQATQPPSVGTSYPLSFCVPDHGLITNILNLSSLRKSTCGAAGSYPLRSPQCRCDLLLIKCVAPPTAGCGAVQVCRRVLCTHECRGISGFM